MNRVFHFRAFGWLLTLKVRFDTHTYGVAGHFAWSLDHHQRLKDDIAALVSDAIKKGTEAAKEEQRKKSGPFDTEFRIPDGAGRILRGVHRAESKFDWGKWGIEAGDVPEPRMSHEVRDRVQKWTPFPFPRISDAKTPLSLAKLFFKFKDAQKEFEDERDHPKGDGRTKSYLQARADDAYGSFIAAWKNRYGLHPTYDEWETLEAAWKAKRQK